MTLNNVQVNMKGGTGTYSEFSFYICIPNQRLSFMTDTCRQRYFLPAEWYEQSGVQLTWPHEDTDWRPYLYEITEVCLNLVRIVARHEKVLVAARDADKVRRLIESSTDEDVRGNIRVYQCENNDTWARAFFHNACARAGWRRRQFQTAGFPLQRMGTEVSSRQGQPYQCVAL